jgi:hypothetical protein
MTKTILGKILSDRYGYDEAFAESLAMDFIRSDCRLNGIKTVGQVLTYLDYLESIGLVHRPN